MNYYGTTIIPSLTPKWKKIISWLTVAVYLTQPSLAAAQVIADGSAPVNQRPAIENAQNGVQVVQITAPSAAGVSRNQYLQFNVDNQGLILNNASSFSQTQLAGYITGNANLAGGSARIILNEVTGPGRSYLNGYAEIAGQRADLIIANPNGITGNGFGFINAGRTTLTTGTPVFGGSGSLEAFRVTQGQIAIEGAGLNASATDRVDLISRAVAVNAGLWAKELNVVNGANQVDYNTLATNSITGTDLQPTVALDVGVLGGMYANKIKLVGTERGLGVNSQGTLAASNGDLILSQAGKISLAGNTSAAGNIAITANDDITGSGTIYAGLNSTLNTSTSISNSGTIAAGQNTELDASQIISTGTLASGIDSEGKLGSNGSLKLIASGQISAQGQNLAGGNLDISGSDLNLQGAVTYARESAHVFATGNIDNSGGQLGSERNLSIIADGDMDNTDGKVSSGGTLQLAVHQLGNKNGVISSGDKLDIVVDAVTNQGGTIKSDSVIKVLATGVLDNQSGQIEAQSGLQIDAQALNNQNGWLTNLNNSGLDIQLTDELDNTAGVIGSNGTTAISAGQIKNTNGQLIAKNSLDIANQNDINNYHGKIIGGKDVTLSASAIENDLGDITAGQNLTIAADRLNSSGQLAAGQDFTAVFNQALVNSGQLQTGRNLNIISGSVTNQETMQAQSHLAIQAIQQLSNSGAIAAGKSVDLIGSSLDSSGILISGITPEGTLGHSGDLVINMTGEVSVTGENLAGGKLSIRGQNLDMNGASTYAGDNIELSATSGVINNMDGSIEAGKKITISASSDLINTNASISGDEVMVSTSNIYNQSGQIKQTGNAVTTIAVSGQLDNTGGQIASNGQDLTITANELNNHQGKIQQAGSGKMIVQVESQLDNNEGQVATNGEVHLTTGTLDNDQGIIFAQKQLEIKAADALKNHDGQLLGNQDIQITASVINNEHGLVEAGNGLIISADSLNNNSGQITSISDSGLIVDVAQLTNQAGLIGSNGEVHISAIAVDNANGQISTKQNLKIVAENTLNNNGGIVSAGNDLQVIQMNGTINNSTGSIQAGNDLRITASASELIGGSYLANKNIHINAHDLVSDNVQAGEDIELNLQGDFTNNDGGQVQANGKLSVNADGTVANGGSIAALEAVSIASSELHNANEAAIKSGGALTFGGTALGNQGTIYAKDQVIINANDKLTTSGTIAAGADLNITADNIDSTGSLVAGLRNNGSVGNTGELTLKATGIVAAKGKNLAGGNMTIQGSSVDLSGATTAGQSISITASDGNIDNSDGSLLAKNELTIQAAGALINDKVAGTESAIKAGLLNLDATKISNRGGILAQVGQSDLSLNTDILDNTGGKFETNSLNLTINANDVKNINGQIVHAGSGKLGVQADSVLDNSNHGEIISNGQVSLESRLIDNSQGNIYAQQQLDIQANNLINRQGQAVGRQSVTVTADLDNTGGLIEASQGMSITGQTLTNDHGTIVSLDQSGLVVTVEQSLTNKNGLLGGNGNVIVTAAELDNVNGQVRANSDLQMETSNKLENSNGLIMAVNNLKVSQNNGVINNEQGMMQAGIDLDIAATNADITGGNFLAGRNGTISGRNLTVDQLLVGENADIQVTQDFTNNEKVQANGTLTIATGGNITNSGSMVALEKITLTGVGVTNTNGADIKSGDQIKVSAADIFNQGTVYAKQDTNLTASNNLTSTGIMASGADLELVAKSINSTGTLVAGLASDGSIGSTGELTIKASDSLIAGGQNIAGGSLVIEGMSVNLSGANTYAGHSASITATTGDINNSGATLTVKDTLDIVAAGRLVNDQVNSSAALIKANQLNVDAENISNRGGVLAQISQSDFNINTGDLDNTSGSIETNSTNLTITAGQLDNSHGQILHAGNGNFDVHTLSNLVNDNGQIISNGTMNLNAQAVNNHHAKVSAKEDLTITAASLDNEDGVTVSAGNVSLTVENSMNNSGGTVEAGGALSLGAKNVNNQNGKLTSLDLNGLTMSVNEAINNRSGLIGGNGNAVIAVKSLDNTGGKVLSAADLQIIASLDVDNTEGKISAGQDLTIHQNNGGLINSKGVVEAGRNLAIQSDIINNAQGRMAANSDLGLNTGILNGSGHVNAGHNLDLTVNNGFTNAADGVWKAANDFSLSANGAITNSGTMEAGGTLTVSGQQITNNAGATLVANEDLTLTATDVVTNKGSIFGNDVVVRADNIINTDATAAIAATNSVKLYTNDSVENKDGALIYSMGNIDIAGSETKNNGEYTTRTKLLLNQSANIEADGDITIYADDVVNTKPELESGYETISSNMKKIRYAVVFDGQTYRIWDGTTPLSEKDQVVNLAIEGSRGYSSADYVDPRYISYLLQGKDLKYIPQLTSYSNAIGYDYFSYQELLGETVSESYIIKDSPMGKIIAGNNLIVNSNNITNGSKFLAGKNLNVSGNVQNITYGNVRKSTKYFANVLSVTVWTPGWDPTYCYDFVLDFYEVTTTEQIPGNTTALFGGGQQVAVDGTRISNVTVAPGSIIEPTKTVDSSNQIGNAVTVKSGTDITDSRSVNTNINTEAVQGPGADSMNSYGQTGSVGAVEADNSKMNSNINASVAIDHMAVDYGDGIIANSPTVVIDSVISNNNDTQVGVGTVSIDLGTVPALLPTAQSEPVKLPQTNNGGTIILPQNGLYTVKNDPTSKYLIETNPKFANYQTFISSDYMLNKLNYDPSNIVKRLGDGFYEQKLVREQITDLTGRVYLGGYDSAEAQYQGLLENGVNAADILKLQIGVGLTAEQQASLTTDLVWLVEQEVEGHKVLVPVVYLSTLREGNLTVNGAIISADSVQLNVTGDIVNTGTIRAIEGAQIGAANIGNIGGSIDGGKLTQINVGQDILNLSGSITGDNIILSAGQNFTSKTYSTINENSYDLRTTISDTAVIAADNTLILGSGQELTLLGTDISAGGDISVIGQNINIATLNDTKRIKFGSVEEQVSNLTTTITAGNNLNMQANQDMHIQAAKLGASNDITLQAGGKLDLSAVADSYIFDYDIDANNYTKKSTRKYQLASVTAGNDLNIVSGNDMTLTGVQAAGNTITALSGGDLILNTVTDSEYTDFKVGDKEDYRHTMSYNQTVIGTNLSATNDVFLGANNSIAITGSSAISEKGGIAVQAGEDITIEAVTEKHESLTESKKTKSGFFSKKTTTKRDYALLNEVVGSTISGETIDITSGNDLTIKASNLVATNDLSITAGNDLTITSVSETGAEEHFKEIKKSGLFSGGGLGFTIGSTSEKLSVKEKTLAEIGSTIGSLAGDITLTAGNQLTSSGANINAKLDLDMIGKKVNIDNTINTFDSSTKYEFKQSGLSVSLGGGVVSTGLDTINSIERANQVADERLQALYAYKAYDNISDLSKIKNNEDLKKDVKVSISLGSSKSSSEQNVHVETINPSNISAGQTVTIIATDSDVDIKGTKLDGKDITIMAVGDINLDAAQNKQQITSNSQSSSWGIGVELGTGIFGSYQKGSSKENGTTITNSSSSVSASDTVTLISGNDTNIIGSTVTGNKIIAEIGGDLNIASLQDIDNYTSKNSSSGIGLSTAGITGSYGNGKTDSTYASVVDQAGIYAGKEGFDINVGGNTDLKGAVIASDADPDKNKLSTDTLTFSDIENKAEYSASSVGVNLDTRKTAEKKDAGLTPAIGTKASGDADSTTHSAIAEGSIEVRNGGTDLSKLSRDTANSLNALGKIFDKKTVAEQQELAKLFGEVAFKAVGDLAERQWEKAATEEEKAKWDEGGEYKVALHTLVGGIMSDLGGGNFASGAAGAGVNEAIQGELSKIKDPALHQWASVLVGTTVAEIVGGDAQSGASVAASATKNNILSHEEFAKMQEELRNCKNEEEKEAVLEKWGKLSKERDEIIEQRKIEYEQATTDEERDALYKKWAQQDESWGISGLGVEFIVGKRPGFIETFLYDPQSSAIENAHKLLSLGGFTPLAPISEGANAIIYFAEGDNESAVIILFSNSRNESPCGSKRSHKTCP